MIRRFRKQMRTLMRPFLEEIAQGFCSVSRWLVAKTHKRLLKIQWGYGPQPEHFDHHIDLFYNWLESRNSLGWERGVFSGLALKGGDVLELACGDGFNARNFYSLRSKKVVACDFDLSAIRTAKRKNTAENIEFVLADIRTGMPNGSFDNIIWDAAIEHFTPPEIENIMRAIKNRLNTGGILSGYTIVEKADGTKSLSHHEYEFRDKQDLQRFLTPHFRNVIVFETIYSERHNLYFWASDGPVPFQPEWPFYEATFSSTEKST